MPQNTLSDSKGFTPDTLSRRIRVVDGRGLTALCIGTGIIVAALLWSVFGSVPVRIQGQGVVVPSGGYLKVVAHNTGRVVASLTASGKTVRKGQIMVLIGPVEAEWPGGRGALQSSYIEIKSPGQGIVRELPARPGDVIAAGSLMAVVEPVGAPMEAVLFLPVRDAENMTAGMSVRLRSSIPGRVTRISPRPATPSGTASDLGVPEGSSLAELIDRIISAQDEPCAAVHVALGGMLPAQQGTGIVTSAIWGEVMVGRKRPLIMAFPRIAQLMGAQRPLNSGSAS